ncbi:hypothetical protein NECAME_11800 [Necator americanus]|uniref:Uncharacterized protein n=1 Tax=Necator americanus TaxID=51031 RepID=W2T5N9_NECAM|nr:hypothetical protein NECAME_11800 [Necator americanus]ETN76262.1 hypothetical protein NECAME_11800 [Necator americanus]
MKVMISLSKYAPILSLPLQSARTIGSSSVQCSVFMKRQKKIDPELHADVSAVEFSKASLGGFETPRSYRTVVKMFYKSFIFPKADKQV